MSSNPWRHVRIDPAKIARNPYVNPPPPPAAGMPLGTPAGGAARGGVPPAAGVRTSIVGAYDIMAQTTTYALGVEALRQSHAGGECPAQPLYVDGGRSIVRPLTFKENIEARVNDYERAKPGDERLRLFQKWLDSCTGIAYKASTTQFKIIPICPELIGIDKDFNSDFLPVRYGSLAVPELDSSQGKYNELLTKDEVLAHRGWQEAVEGDTALLKTYRDIIFAEKSRSTDLMRFWVRQNTPSDELRALFVNYLDDGSDADGNNNLNTSGSFLRVAHRRAPGGSP